MAVADNTKEEYTNEELIELSRQVVKLGFKEFIKHSPKDKKLLYTTLYWQSLASVINVDILPLVRTAYLKFVNKARLDNDYLLSTYKTLPYISIKEFFKSMQEIDETSRTDIIDSMEGLNMAVKEQLIDAVANNNYDGFYNIIQNNNYDLSDCAKLAKAYSLIKNSTPLICIEYENLDKISPEAKEYIHQKFPGLERILTIPLEKLNDDELKMLTNYIKWMSGINKGNAELSLSELPEMKRDMALAKLPRPIYDTYQSLDIPDDYEEYIAYSVNGDFPRFFMNMNERVSTLQDNNQEVSAKKSDIITNIDNESDDNEDKQDKASNILSNHDELLFPDSKYGFIPEDYFDEFYKASGIYDEYFNTELFNEHLRKDKLDEFVKLINYLGDMGYIENNNRTKAILAYRLTGLIRPSGEVIEKIDWDASTPSRLLALLYLIRHWTRHVNPKYKKCIDFFNNIKAEDVANGSSKTKDAANEFQDFLNMLYGDSLFPIEHEKQRKALKK